MDEAAARTEVEWRPFDRAAFRAARETDRLVLVAVTAPWCEWCHEMDADAYADPRAAAFVNDAFVPVRVDADRRPRVRERYNAGGFPSTVVCTPDGEVVTAATYLEPDALRSVLDRVHERFRAGDVSGQVPRALREQPPAGTLTGDVEGLVAGQLSATYDAEHAGWGTAEKFPLPATVAFALKREREQALATLDAVERALVPEEGGCYRYAAARDWSDPARERLLDTSAAVLAAFAHAYAATGDAAYREPADRILTYLDDRLRQPSGFAGSEAAPEDPAGGVDDTVFADRNAVAATACAWYHAYTDDDRARDCARHALDALDALRDGGVLHHYGDSGAPTGLLVDHARAARAYAAAAQVLDPAYLPAARAVADHALDALRDETGTFRDGPAAGAGLLSRPLRPLDDAARLANALVDLAALAGEDDYRDAARASLSAFADAADRVGVQAAVYATAAARAVDGPLVLEVAADPGSDLHRAALRVADHEKVVVPDADAPPAGTARVVTDAGASDPAPDPDALLDRIGDAHGD